MLFLSKVFDTKFKVNFIAQVNSGGEVYSFEIKVRYLKT